MIAKQKIHGFVTAFDYNNQKMELKNTNDRAELLDHNFFKYDRHKVLKEVAFLKQLRPNLTRDAYHVSLNFAPTDQLTTQQLVRIGRDYLAGMGFEDNAYAIWQHFDADHLHIHLLACRINYDGSVVTDSNNYQRSENICRQLEKKYGLENVRSSKEALDRAPNKDELEMIQRTGTISNRILMQERVKAALSTAQNISDFIAQCKGNGVYLIFNQSESTGRISGITYMSVDGFVAKGQKLGNQYKWSNLINKLNYEQSRDRQTIGETNRDTRERFKELLDQGNGRNENRNSQTRRASNNGYEESGHFTSKDGSDFQRRNESRSHSDPSRDTINQESEQDFEEAVSNQFSTGASAVISGLSGLLGSIGGDEIDEDEKRKKRKIKR
ncbi:relaxase/mobilization nuclease domain-containing protein [Sphingobacterium multivorum]|uniref:relaxase/mobilization nuclease domain-containing protein n=1 Tax=Sphingobacterium multivorum TaxID=28454 RepID=UPI002FD8847B